MDFWNRLRRLFAPGRAATNRYLDVYILNFRCNEPLATQIDLYNDPSPADEGAEAAFFVRKLLSTSGLQRCFATNEIQIWLDRNRRVVNYEVEGGRWLDPEEYAKEIGLFRARMAEQAQVPTRNED